MVYNNDVRVKEKRNMENRMDTVYIKDIQVGMKNFSLACIVLEVGPLVSLKENREVRTFKVADSSACINLAVFDDPGHYINASDIIRLTKLYAAVWRNSLTLYISKIGTIEKIGEFCMVFNDQLNMSDIAQPPPSVAVTNPPPNGNPALGGSGVLSGYINRTNLAAAVQLNPQAGGPSTQLPSSGGPSRYDTSRTSRNGQHVVEDTNMNPRSRGDRR